MRIGNSRGVRLPKPVIEEAGLADTAELTLERGAIVIRPVRAVREGWAQSAAELAARDAGLLMPVDATHFDREEWAW